MRSLCATFGTYTDPDESTAPTTVVKYEKQTVTEPDVVSTTTLCKFALFVTSPPLPYPYLIRTTDRAEATS